MKTVCLLHNPQRHGEENLYYRLVRIRFIYHRRSDPPYSIWAHYRKEGEAYLLDEYGPHRLLPDWIPEEEHQLTTDTHRIKIVSHERDVRPLHLKGVKQRQRSL